jgi:hypothetical protein
LICTGRTKEVASHIPIVPDPAGGIEYPVASFMEAGAPKQLFSGADKLGVDVDQRTVRDLRVNFAHSEHSSAVLVVDWYVEAPFELEGNPVDADGANAREPIHIDDKIIIRVSELASHMCRNLLDIGMSQEKRRG